MNTTWAEGFRLQLFKRFEQRINHFRALRDLVKDYQGSLDLQYYGQRGKAFRVLRIDGEVKDIYYQSKFWSHYAQTEFGKCIIRPELHRILLGSTLE